MGLTTDIKVNVSPIRFGDNVYLDKLKISSLHPDNNKVVFVNTDTGELYSADLELNLEELVNFFELSVPYNQEMVAEVAVSDGDLACYDSIDLKPSGYVSIYVNGIRCSLGDGKAFYFSDDEGITAKDNLDIQQNDKLFCNPSILGYSLDTNDRISLDYMTSTSFEDTPLMVVNISGGSFGDLSEGSHVLTPTVYNEPPLEEWRYNMDANNFIRFFLTEGSSELINTSQISVGGVQDTFVYLAPLATDDQDKRIADALFKSYTINGITITLSRGVNWNDHDV